VVISANLGCAEFVLEKWPTKERSLVLRKRAGKKADINTNYLTHI